MNLYELILLVGAIWASILTAFVIIISYCLFKALHPKPPKPERISSGIDQDQIKTDVLPKDPAPKQESPETPMPSSWNRHTSSVLKKKA